MLSKSWLYLNLSSISAGRRRGGRRRLHGRVRQIQRVHALQVAADGLRPERHGAVHPRADPGGTSALDVAAEAGRNFDGGLDVPASETIFELGVVGERRLLHEIARASELLEIGAALGTLIVIEHGEGEIVDVGRNAESEHQHQKRRAEQAEPEPDRVAQELQGLADRIGEQAPQAEPGTLRRRRSRRSGGSSDGAGAAGAEARDPVASSR